MSSTSDSAAILPQDGVLSTRRSNLTGNLLLLLSSVLLTLLGIEVLFRIAAPSIAVPHWSDRPKRYFVPEDSGDNRNAGIAPVKAPNTFRIIVLGDSFSFGVYQQFDDTFPKRLERILNLNIKQRRVEVLNWGVPGFSTRQEVRLLNQAVKSFSPDLILMQITLNDPELQPYRVTNKNMDAAGKIVFNHSLLHHWKSLEFAYRRILNSQSHREYIQYYFDLFNKPETWNSFRTAVEDFHQITSSHHIPLLAVVFPLFSHPLDDSYPFAPLHKKTAELLEQNQIPYLDLFSAYKNIPNDRLTIIPNGDSHPNEIAHRMAAEALFQRLTHDHLIPKDAKPVRIAKHRVVRNPFFNEKVATPSHDS